MTDNTNKTPLADSYEQWLELNPAPVESSEPSQPEPDEDMIKAARSFGFNPDVPGFWAYDYHVGTCALIGGVAVRFGRYEGKLAAYVGKDVINRRGSLRKVIEMINARRAHEAAEKAERDRKAARPKVVRVLQEHIIASCDENGLPSGVAELLADGYVLHSVPVLQWTDGSPLLVYILALPDALTPR